MNLEKANKYIKILETPILEKQSTKILSFDKETKDLIETIIKNNTEENNKTIYNNLKNLKINKGSLFFKIIINPILKLKNIKMYGCYNIFTNTIFINKNDEKVIGHELVHMASTIVKNNEAFVGFAQQFSLKTGQAKVGIGLTEGYTSLEAERLFGYESSKEKMKDRNIYDIEKDISKKLEMVIGQNKMKKYFYNANLLGLIKELKKIDSIENIIEFITDIDSIHKLNITNKNKQYTTRIQELTRKSFLTLYKWNSFKRKEEYENGIISNEEYTTKTLNFSRLYTLDIMKLFNYNTDNIIEEKERTI